MTSATSILTAPTSQRPIGQRRKMAPRVSTTTTLALISISAIAPLPSSAAKSHTEGVVCRRWDHQSAVVDNKLYLFGGYKLLPEHIRTDLDSDLYNNGTGEWTNDFVYLDLTKPFQLEKDKDLNNPPEWKSVDAMFINGGKIMPGIAGGGFFTYEKEGMAGFVLYDGKYTHALNDAGRARDAKSQLLSFDVYSRKWTLEDEWTNTSPDSSPLSTKISRYSRGTMVDVPGRNKGFYIGGARIWETEDEYDWYYPENIQLTQFDFEGKIERKMGPLLNNTKTIAPAAVWVPIGEQGSLVMIGGSREQPEDRRFGRGKNDTPSQQYVLPTYNRMRGLNETYIYDIARDKWFVQETKDSPWYRQGACLVSRSFKESDGNITYQLYMYGGDEGSSFGKGDPMDERNTYGDLWVLSIPSFRWFNFHELGNSPNKRTRHTCHVINERQLLIVGGGRNGTVTRDKACVWDELSVLDMSAMEWQLEYKPTNESYTVNKRIRDNSLVNGVPGTSPDAGWSSGVQEWYEQQYKTDITITSNKSEGNLFKTKFPVILGVVLGSVAAALLFLVGRRYWYRRKYGWEETAMAPITPYSEARIGIEHGTQALPNSTPKLHQNPWLSAPGAGDISPESGIPPTIGSGMSRPVSELPSSPDSHRTTRLGSWGSVSHAYAPLPPIESGPLTLSTHGGQTFIAELDGSRPQGYGYGVRTTPYDPVMPSAAVFARTTSPTESGVSQPPLSSQYLESEEPSPYLAQGHFVKHPMTHDESRRVSRDIETLMRGSVSYGTSGAGGNVFGGAIVEEDVEKRLLPGDGI
ncbi:hypothetical protein BDZ91DRAFT_794930 [Kalaharituber pfeilii]|nr:hypothetical protein BDZ91DRAFT_794930 [Kalaharituber pfeilii]